MARPQRNDVDYFPFYCKEGGTTEYVESAYGNDGFAVWVKILRALAKTKYHYLNLNDKKLAMPFVAKCKVSEDFLHALITDLVELGEFDAELWNDHRIVWSQKFTDSVEDAYKKRSNKIVKKDELLQLLVDLGVRKPGKSGSIGPVNPQSRVEYSIVENSIEEAACITVEETVFEVTVSREAENLKDAICEHFEVKKILTSKHYSEIDRFVETVRHRNEIPIVAAALKNYVAYKARSQEQKHGFQKWIGTHELHYNDGVWFTTDWEKKLKNYNGDRTGNQKANGGTKSFEGANYGTKF